MTDSAPVIVTKTGNIGRLTLNRPEALHALTTEMCLIMSDALTLWRDDDEVGLVLVDHAAGTRGFCAGGDIRMLAESGARDGKDATEFFAAEYRLNAQIKAYPKPYIALINGITMGGGVGISVHGHYCIATENTVFAMPETGIGLFPDVGGGWFLPRLEGELGMWLALTGARLKGSDVVAAGIATDYVPSELLGNLIAQIEQADFSAGATDMLEAILSPLRKTYPVAGFEAYENIINTCFASDSVEDIIAALEAEGSDWSKAQVSILATKSPQTLKVAFRQLREGAAFTSFEDNMRNEYRIGWRQVRSADFQEGVRAVIIDKDGKPDWPSGKISDISEKKLDEIFALLGENELRFK